MGFGELVATDMPATHPCPELNEWILEVESRVAFYDREGKRPHRPLLPPLLTPGQQR